MDELPQGSPFSQEAELPFVPVGASQSGLKVYCWILLYHGGLGADGHPFAFALHKHIHPHPLAAGVFSTR